MSIVICMRITSVIVLVRVIESVVMSIQIIIYLSRRLMKKKIKYLQVFTIGIYITSDDLRKCFQ